MPELPEVHTTVTGLQKVLPGLVIKDIWSDMWSSSYIARNTHKNKHYFKGLYKETVNQKILRVHRRAKHILIDLANGYTLIIHMKMTGHLMYGVYKQNETASKKVVKEWAWIPADKNTTRNKNLLDPYNRHIHVVFTLQKAKNITHLAFCDSRKFGTIVYEKTSELEIGKLSHLGPEPLLASFTLAKFKEQLLLSPKRAIKTVLMDQSIISGIGNIYSDEMLHRAHILPTRATPSLTPLEFKNLFSAMKLTLKKGIDFGGDSTSDYRNIDGARGSFHENHLVYLRTGERCKTKNCKGRIVKKTINGRSAHYCPVCQK